jgi:hypothetical protein
MIEKLIFFIRRLQIPNHEELYLGIAQREQNNKVDEYIGQKKTLKLITRNSY